MKEKLTKLQLQAERVYQAAARMIGFHLLGMRAETYGAQARLLDEGIAYAKLLKKKRRKSRSKKR